MSVSVGDGLAAGSDNTLTRIRQVVAGAAFEGLHPHDFRHYAAGVLDDAGVATRSTRSAHSSLAHSVKWKKPSRASTRNQTGNGPALRRALPWTVRPRRRQPSRIAAAPADLRPGIGSPVRLVSARLPATRHAESRGNGWTLLLRLHRASSGPDLVAMVDQLHADAYVMPEFKRGQRLPEPVFVLLPCLVDVGASKGGGFHEERRALCGRDQLRVAGEHVASRRWSLPA